MTKLYRHTRYVSNQIRPIAKNDARNVEFGSVLGHAERHLQLKDAFAVITPTAKNYATRGSGIERDVGEAFEPLWRDRKFTDDGTRDNMTLPAKKRRNCRVQLKRGIGGKRTQTDNALV